VGIVTAQACGFEAAAGAIGQPMTLMYFFELVELRLAVAGAIFFKQLGDDAAVRAAVFLRGLAGAPGERDVLVPGAPEPKV